MPAIRGQSIGGLLDPSLTTLTLNQRRTMQNLLSQGIAPAVARNLAIALTKSAAVPVQKKSYHQAFSEAAKEILPEPLSRRLHMRARAIAGGYGKAARRREDAMTEDAKSFHLEKKTLLEKSDGVTPPKGVQSACRRGLELAPEYGGAGLTEGAKARARSMAQGNAVSADQLRRMRSFFARHSADKKSGWSSPPTPGYVAWMLWGGDAGKSWAASKKDSVEKSFDEASHPRADNGQFSDGGGGGSSVGLKASEQHKQKRDEHFAAAREADRRGDYKAASRHRAAAVQANKDAIKAIRSEGKDRRTSLRNEARALRSNGSKKDKANKPASPPSRPDAERAAAKTPPPQKPADEPQASAPKQQSASGAKAALNAQPSNDKGGAQSARPSSAAGSPPNEPKGTDRHARAFIAQSGAQHARELKISQSKADKYRASGKAGLAQKHQQNADAHRNALREIAEDKTAISAERGKALYEGALHAYHEGRRGKEGVHDYFRTLSPAERDFVASVDAGIARQEKSAQSVVIQRAAQALRIAKGNKPMGAAFARARATGKKQDHKSRKRRANKYLRSQGHEPISKMEPQTQDVRAEQFLKLVRERKKKRQAQKTQKSERISVSVPARIVKAEQQAWQRLVWSVVYEPDTLDLHGDFMDADTIQKAAHDAMRSGIYVNSEHRGDPLDAQVVESYTAPCDFSLQTADGDVTVTKGSWVQCLHIKDDVHWQGVLDGTYTGFSLEGMALAQAV